MAKVELMPCIESLSGRVGNIIFKTYKNGQVRMYPAAPSQRRTPVSKAETANRSLFMLIAREVNRLKAVGDPRSRKVLWNVVRKQMTKG